MPDPSKSSQSTPAFVCCFSFPRRSCVQKFAITYWTLRHTYIDIIYPKQYAAKPPAADLTLVCCTCVYNVCVGSCFLFTILPRQRPVPHTYCNYRGIFNVRTCTRAYRPCSRRLDLGATTPGLAGSFLFIFCPEEKSAIAEKFTCVFIATVSNFLTTFCLLYIYFYSDQSSAFYYLFYKQTHFPFLCQLNF